MTIGIGILITAVGAILAYAVDAQAEGFDVQTAGVILMIAGVVITIGAAIATLARRRTVVEGYATPVAPVTTVPAAQQTVVRERVVRDY